MIERFTRRSVLAGALPAVPAAHGAVVGRSHLPAARASGPNDPNRPHVVLVVLDDMRDSDWLAMPKTKEFMDPRGTVFPNYVCENPVCGPARASLLTGRHSGNTGIRTNEDAEKGLSGANLPQSLQRRGYRTALFGKYLNFAGRRTPAGWDVYEPRDENNVDLLRRRAVRWLGETRTGPVFLYLAPMAPHLPLEPPGRYRDLYPTEPQPSRARLQECRAVDDLVAAVVDRLRDQGRLGRTVLVVASDNGYHLGEHGLNETKGSPYAESLRVSMRAMGPGIPAGAESTTLVCPQDIPTTLARLTRATLGGADGVDFVRESLPHRLIQYYQPRPLGPWTGLAGPDWTYVEWADPERTPSYLVRSPGAAVEDDTYDALPDGRKAELRALLAAERGRSA